MLALIIVVCIGAITTMGGNANKTFSNVALNTGRAGRDHFSRGEERRPGLCRQRSNQVSEG
jgi:hypothetical protein